VITLTVQLAEGSLRPGPCHNSHTNGRNVTLRVVKVRQSVKKCRGHLTQPNIAQYGPRRAVSLFPEQSARTLYLHLFTIHPCYLDNSDISLEHIRSVGHGPELTWLLSVKLHLRDERPSVRPSVRSSLCPSCQSGASILWGERNVMLHTNLRGGVKSGFN